MVSLKDLRGDITTDLVDIYDHIDKKEMKAYLAGIPVLGIN